MTNTAAKSHKPVVVLSETHPPYCRICGVPVDRRMARNGRLVSSHANTDDRFPVLDADLKPIN
jgi:hypothetical protein